MATSTKISTLYLSLGGEKKTIIVQELEGAKNCMFISGLFSKWKGLQGLQGSRNRNFHNKFDNKFRFRNFTKGRQCEYSKNVTKQTQLLTFCH